MTKKKPSRKAKYRLIYATLLGAVCPTCGREGILRIGQNADATALSFSVAHCANETSAWSELDFAIDDWERIASSKEGALPPVR